MFLERVLTLNGDTCEHCAEIVSQRAHLSYTTQCKKIVVLEETSWEYKFAAEKFIKTLNRSCHIIKIEKSVNELLLDKFTNFQKAYNEPVHYLFHGCKKAENHKSILEGGFQLKYALQGSLGKGIYFAENASYSDSGYSYETPNAEKVMLLCRVILPKDLSRKSGDIRAVFKDELCYPEYLIYYTYDT